MTYISSQLAFGALAILGVAVIVLGAASRSRNRPLVITAGATLVGYVLAAYLWSRFSFQLFSPADSSYLAINLGATIGLQLLQATPVALLVWAGFVRRRPQPTPPQPTWPGRGPKDGSTGGHW